MWRLMTAMLVQGQWEVLQMGRKFLHDESGNANDDVWVGILIFLIVASLILLFLYYVVYKFIIIKFIVPHLIEIFILFMIGFIIYLIKSIRNKITMWIQPTITALEKPQISRTVTLNLLYIAPMYYKYYKGEKKLDQLKIEFSNIETKMLEHLNRIRTIEKQIEKLKKKPLGSSSQQELSIANEKLLKEKKDWESLDKKKTSLYIKEKSVKERMNKIKDKAYDFIIMKNKNKQLKS